ncbi:MAG: hypothetical protein K940chlam2_01164 [Chlamydiae bacterium]|nr:hypothetical protein [Chlamydiota bacterium]
MKLIVLKGKDILPYLDQVAQLRMGIYREWPYLYEGDLATEKNYLKVYAEAKDSLLVVATEGDQVIGIAIGLPLNESIEQIQDVFREKQVSMENCYYFADEVLIKEYRGQIGLTMNQKFEQAVGELKRYGEIYGFEIVREANDPRKPEGYRSLDPLWEKLGYGVIPGWEAHVEWLDVGDAEKTSHLMRFRKKSMGIEPL